ncbi:cyclic GMP-AMP synthase DncV-like nucleotidyltransferase [Stenotrophomonas indicatrix]|uniref:cyclic GMP-AMP synthase DncV-like nucleotidyltransferase n=1 Tax=Stenotrophomonas indicatrix TaxID=2045451 RepID=UPI0028AFE0D7|nr:hypothetical protein [Stenotrophomonas indicatrix]
MAGAASLFHSDNAEIETLNRRVRPSDGQREYLLEHKNELAAWLAGDLDDLGMEVSHFIQGSYKFHTLIRPLKMGDEYDVDLGLYFKGKPHADVDPAELREAVQRSLRRYIAENDDIQSIEEPKERCCRAKYKQSFHIDVPVYHETPAGRDVRLATLSKGWERSDPSAMIDWFDDAIGGAAANRAMIRRLIRYLKAWSALTFRSPAIGPSSLMLTILVIDAFKQVVADEDEDDDALAKVISAMYERLVSDKVVPNPIQGDTDNDVNRLSAQDYEHFLEKLAALVDVSHRAVCCEHASEAAAIWSEAFSYVFPLPEDLGVLAASQNGLSVPTPDIAIKISTATPGAVERIFRGQVDHARIGEGMTFEITNPEVIPSGAQIRWVVRNSGNDALSTSDLGHVTPDDGTFRQFERAAYRGRHFMDCEVWLHGRLRSVTRVSVTIDRIAMPPRVRATRPSYTRLMRR